MRLDSLTAVLSALREHPIASVASAIKDAPAPRFGNDADVERIRAECGAENRVLSFTVVPPITLMASAASLIVGAYASMPEWDESGGRGEPNPQVTNLLGAIATVPLRRRETYDAAAMLIANVLQLLFSDDGTSDVTEYRARLRENIEDAATVILQLET